ncbi:MAG TPA: NAD-dependent epimerase/dehydratase family protein, partial [Magnetospirillaceae bacterium]|nr:NAD-dependent epimerase/dehydratase family protein [Magnetospirillaceae bacterium]
MSQAPTHHYCTYFDSLYAPRGLIMIGSLFRHQPDAVVHVLCLDDLCLDILQALAPQIPRVHPISLEELEKHDPELAACKGGRSKIEFYFTCTPCLPSYVLAQNPDIADITYLDADLFFYRDANLIFDEIGDKSIAITPHKFPPTGKHNERYGIYNVAWITWRNDEIGRKCLADYRRNCIAWCYDHEEDGKFGDQKYLDSWPEDYGSVAILDHKGVNVALWNVDNYDIQKREDGLYIDEQPLIFFHFHAVYHFGPGEFYVPFRETGVQKDIDRLVELLYQPYTELVEMTGRQLSPDGAIKFYGSKRYPIGNVQSGPEAAPPESPWNGKRVLVAGGLGFIGSTLARKLAEAGADVVVLDSLLPDYGGHRFNLGSYGADPQGGRIRVNISDLRDQNSLARLVEDREVVFNLAAQLSHMASMQDPLTDLDINARAVAGLLELCRKLPDCRVIYASTRQVYGRPQYLPVDEKHPVVPVDVNAINKIAGEHYHTLYAQVHGMKTAVLRMTNVYGPRMRIKDARQTFLGVWIRSALENKPFEVWGGEQLRDLTYVD